MHYLQRDERREGIMQAAMRLALRGGFSAMTVRQIAREAQVAAGQLHHHFASIGELKSQVFIRLIREMLDMPLVAEDASWRERLFSMIGSEDAEPISACGGKARYWPTATRTSKRPTC